MKRSSVSRVFLLVALVSAVAASTVLNFIMQFIGACFAALVALVPIVLGPAKLRFYGVIPIAIATWVAVNVYPDARQEVLLHRLYGVVRWGAKLGTALDQRWSSTRTLPASLQELGIPLPQSNIVADVHFDSKDRFTVALALSPASQRRLVFTAMTENGERVWKCADQEPDPGLRAPGCREEYTPPDLASPGAAQPVDAPDPLRRASPASAGR